MPDPMKGSDSIVVKAPPDKIWALVSDVTRMGEWSPETQSAAWTGTATGPAAGATFAGRNRRGWVRWTGKCDVTVADPGREFAFVRRGPHPSEGPPGAGAAGRKAALWRRPREVTG